jgi:MoaD family protein
MTMGVKVLIPTALRLYADSQDTVELDGARVGDVLNNLAEKYPNLRTHLFNDNGKLRNFVNVYVNDQNIRTLDLERTPLKDGDEVTLVPAVAGGNDVLHLRTDGVALNNEEIERYSRHLILPEVGMEGQKKLKAASILLIGTGGLGSPLGMYLAAAGIGRLGLVDFDVVDKSNLQRQIIHTTHDVGRPKIQSAAEKIAALNPHVVVETYNTGLTSENAFDIIKNYDIVIDGTDNFPTRYLVNDACVLLGKPNVYGSIFRFEGQASVFYAEKGPCYRCLYPEPPPPGMVPSCAEGGVLGILPGIVGLIQATEGIKLILGEGQPLIGRLLLFNALTMTFRELRLHKDPACPLCGEDPTIKELIDYKEFCGIPSQPREEKMEEQDGVITPAEVKARLDRGDTFILVDVREPHEWDICRIEGAILIPLSEFQNRMHELEKSAEIVVHCKMGGRSAKAQGILQAAGFERVLNMAGGITRWADEVDPAVPKY